MKHDGHPDPGGSRSRTAFNVALALLLGIAAYFLLTEHSAHLGSFLVWGVLLACPLLHMFMHGHHADHGHDRHRHGGDRDDRGTPSARSSTET